MANSCDNVFQVTKTKEHYISNIEEREEGGTPAIVESIRAGLAFQLKQVSAIWGLSGNSLKV